MNHKTNTIEYPAKDKNNNNNNNCLNPFNSYLLFCHTPLNEKHQLAFEDKQTNHIRCLDLDIILKHLVFISTPVREIQRNHIPNSELKF